MSRELSNELVQTEIAARPPLLNRRYTDAMDVATR